MTTETLFDKVVQSVFLIKSVSCFMIYQRDETDCSLDTSLDDDEI